MVVERRARRRYGAARRTAVRTAPALLVLLVGMAALGGCSGDVLSGMGTHLTGGSIPSSDPDILGFVLEAPAATAQGFPPTPGMLLRPDSDVSWPPMGTPVPDVEVKLEREGAVIAATTSDHQGRFAFPDVPSAQYNALAVPPPERPFREGRLPLEHMRGQQTRIIIFLDPKTGEATVPAALPRPAPPPRPR